MYQQIVKRVMANWLRSKLSIVVVSGAISVALVIPGCATSPSSFVGDGLEAMPVDSEVLIAVSGPLLTESFAAVVEEVAQPIPDWLIGRVVMLRVGIVDGLEPVYLISISGAGIDHGIRAQLLISPDWFYVMKPFPHFRSVHAAALLPGEDVIVLTNLPLDYALNAVNEGAFVLPPGVEAVEDRADLLLIIPDPVPMLTTYAPESGLDSLVSTFGVRDLWIAGTSLPDGLEIEGAFDTPDARLSRLIVMLASQRQQLAGIRLQSEEASVTLQGVMGYREIVELVGPLLGGVSQEVAQP